MATTLLGVWTATGTANDALLTLTTDAVIPSGARLILATNRSTGVATTNGVASVTDLNANTWTKDAHACRASTHDLSFQATTLAAPLAAGDIDIVFNGTSTRKVAILAAFSEVTNINGASSNPAYALGDVSVGDNGSSALAAASLASGEGLVVAAFSRAGAATATPSSPAGISTAATAITAAGSSERGLTLAYYTSDVLGSQAASATLSASQGWAALLASYDATVDPPPEILGSVVVGGVKKAVVGESVIVGGVKKAVVSKAVIVGGVKKAVT